MKENWGYNDYKELLDRFVELTSQEVGASLVSVVLYGSVARGTARRESDMDLLIVIREASPVYYERLKPVVGILRQMRRQRPWVSIQKKGAVPYISVLILSVEEASENRYIFLDMVEEAIILLDQNDFFRARLEALGTRLRELGAKRVRSNGNWHWDLKPDLQPGEVLVL